ncbi:phosphatase PAP2 family protein [Marinomonas algicola]|uniref:phosphatase PAP2 family protein n=1 Tax=Marinomonas algicola TaxID=2773454 RepID=UPI00174C5E5E
MTIYSLNKKLGYIAWAYALIIMVGSVHLAWHYALDGYFALILTTIIWFSVKTILKRFPLPQAQHSQDLDKNGVRSPMIS